MHIHVKGVEVGGGRSPETVILDLDEYLVTQKKTHRSAEIYKQITLRYEIWDMGRLYYLLVLLYYN